jgi:broad specificity phosphatase PhoE
MKLASDCVEIFLLRHAEVHNPGNLAYGRLPRFRLSERGRQQAEMAGRFLSIRDVSAIYTSPLLRARQTASVVSRYHPSAPVRTSADLMEVFTGYEGRPNTIYDQPNFSFYYPLARPDDETMADVLSRMLHFIRRIARRHAGCIVLAVSHADPIAITRLGLESAELSVTNLHATVYPARASLTQVRLVPDDPPRLSYFNVAGAQA